MWVSKEKWGRLNDRLTRLEDSIIVLEREARWGSKVTINDKTGRGHEVKTSHVLHALANMVLDYEPASSPVFKPKKK